MNDLRVAAQQALEALEIGWSTTHTGKDARELGMKAITALRAALAESVQESTCAAPLACSGIDKCVFRYNAQFPSVNAPTIGCNVCGLKAQTWGYVCPRLDCPTKVTC